MICKNCSAKLPNDARFCLKCGFAIPLQPSQPVAARPAPSLSTASAAPPFAPYKSEPLPKKWIAVGLLLLVLGVAGAMYWKSSRVTGAAGNSVLGNLVNAPGSGRGVDMVQAPGEAPKNEMVQAPGQGKERPIEIEDYLKFLKEIENTKQRLIRSQTGEALKMLTRAQTLRATIEEETYNDTFKGINNTMNYQAEDWNKLTTQFQSKAPPAACQELHDKYYDHLGKLQTIIMQVNDAMNAVNKNPQEALGKLTQLQGKASIDMDEAIRKADDSLSDVCSKAGIRKDFDVRGDASSSGSLFH